jgi:ssDNA-binding Zn-finger/Zn-ribbon topoisomerase 1
LTFDKNSYPKISKAIRIFKMNFNNLQFYISNLRPWLTLFVIVWLLGSVGLSWLVNSLLIIVGLLFLAPVIAFVGFRWWLQRNLIADKCPVCTFEMTGLNNTSVQCPNCGEQLTVEKGHFHRITPEGTIDITAIEVPVRSLEET